MPYFWTPKFRDSKMNIYFKEKISLAISKAKREHTGIYTLVVTSEAGEDKACFQTIWTIWAI